MYLLYIRPHNKIVGGHPLLLPKVRQAGVFSYALFKDLAI
jgi:hypothetical protein